MNGNIHVQFLGEGVAVTPPPYPARMEKDAAGCPSLPLHYGFMNPGTRRTSPAVYPTVCAAAHNRRSPGDR
jgi:hypothetical protein